MPKRKQQEAESSDYSDSEEEVPQDPDPASQTSDSESDSVEFPSGSADDSEEEESEDDEDGEAFDSINVDFEFYDPQEKDFQGLKALLHTYLDGEQYNCSELIEAIIEQTSVGTVIKCGEDDDPIGVCTVFNLQQNAKLKSVAELKDFLLAHCPDDSSKESLRKAWSAAGSGLVVSERLINCPPQLAPPLQQNLFDEIKSAVEEEEVQEVRDAYKFKRYIMVARVYTDPEQQQREGGQPSGSAAGGKQKKGKRQKQTIATPALIYSTPEAECFHAHAAWSFTFPTPNRPVGKHDLVPHRLVMCVGAAKVPTALKELEVLVAAGEGGDE